MELSPQNFDPVPKAEQQSEPRPESESRSNSLPKSKLYVRCWNCDAVAVFAADQEEDVKKLVHPFVATKKFYKVINEERCLFSGFGKFEHDCRPTENKFSEEPLHS